MVVAVDKKVKSCTAVNWVVVFRITSRLVDEDEDEDEDEDGDDVNNRVLNMMKCCSIME